MTDGTENEETVADLGTEGEFPAPDEPSAEPAAEFGSPEPDVPAEPVASEVADVAEDTIGGENPEAESASDDVAPDVTEPVSAEIPEQDESEVAESAESAAVDDVSAAIAEVDANFDRESPLGEPAAPAAGPADALDVPVIHTVSWIPFIVYDVVWLVFAGVMVWLLSELPRAQVMFESQLYPIVVAGGLVLAITGPLLIVAVWAVASGKDGARKGSLFVSSLVRGSIATLLGVALWWVALVLLDQLRLGRLL